jgi:transcriptional regulator with XRE-family HTH domain
MDMQLNKEQLRRAREVRAWSQSHLAEVAGLSMRTVQRIENSGSASLESAKAIAAAFDTHVEALLSTEPVAPVIARPMVKRVSLIAAFIASVLLAFGWWSSAYAEQVTVDVAISSGDKPIASAHLLNEVGEPSEMKVDDVLKIKITSSKQADGNIFLNAEIYFYNGKAFELKANPKLLVANKQSAAVSASGGDGVGYHFIFTPHL